MKKILLALLLVAGFVQAEQTINPKESGPFEKDRLVTQEVSGSYDDYVLTDLKTGCQYIGNVGYGHRLTLLGCDQTLIDPKFKK